MDYEAALGYILFSLDQQFKNNIVINKIGINLLCCYWKINQLKLLSLVQIQKVIEINQFKYDLALFIGQNYKQSKLKQMYQN
ncbi:hypothetical protein TTHERM_00422210 (macronuclear) [Tetrahymena thermophila SB210]|uniref:Uncharacterized protein n=1 Tax=Tetrahymena thermophila (strain SB210) TaxID=312017 RepID=Q23AP1_TETTS|nr:hypothetical protein TTHERM_00422210 [Tetrahymena thermophila SB210]EAR93451.1 hypothetical protein TTHERM_00422210 [Tetrahymena thermophila SB210]|eukprot:XP_001013696.1 hypothetical protein TTHERM_00422210 [Tetrahymena thermophila SB210]